MKLEEHQFSFPEVERKKLSPFCRGLLWGVIFSLTVTISTTIGATATLMSPSLFETVQLLCKSWVNHEK